MRLLKDIHPSGILFLDIETVPMVSSYDELNHSFRALWDRKSRYFRKEEEDAADVFERAGIYAEFGKIICISVGFIAGREDQMSLRLKSFYSHDEKKLLEDFNTVGCFAIPCVNFL